MNKQEYFDFFENKKIALFGVNKDLIGFLKYKKDGFFKSSCEIKYIIDLTLDYRPQIRAILESVITDEIVITTTEELQTMDSDCKTILWFEGGFRSNDDQVNVRTWDIRELDGLIKDRWDWYLERHGSKSEFTFQYLKDEAYALQFYFIYSLNIDIVLAYWAPDYVLNMVDSDLCDFVSRLDEIAQEKYLNHFFAISPTYVPAFMSKPQMAFYGNELPLMEIKKLKPIFVIGSDYGVGKGTFLRSKYNGEDNILLTDPYMILINPNIYTEMYEGVNINAFLLKNIARLGITNKEEIYLKIDGRLEDFAYNMPRPKREQFSNLHELFYDSKFVIVIKENEYDMRCLQHCLSIFKKRMDLTDGQIKIYENNPSTNILKELEFKNE